ncbi:MAG: nitronate monooxygenase [Armatimonadetes bacterium]|nr:nitronate monooxygenase [Armatimonadota bacterium]MDE2205126.1 nitronate monooxygenase [Armatimonadota bacterium]
MNDPAARLRQLLGGGMELPVMQAPTGSIATPELAAAVSAAGGIGSLGLTWHTPEAAADAVRRTRLLTVAPFVANFALAFDPVGLPAVLEAGVPIVSFSWGDPAPYAPLLRSAGVPFGVQVGSRQEAAVALGSRPDFLICQGVEAGGHVQSSASLGSLMNAVAALGSDTPLIAAGGIADAEGIAGALLAGACAVILGTRFVATIESGAHEVYKHRLTTADGSDTRLTFCFRDGWPDARHRVLRNQTLEMWEAAGSPPPRERPGEGDVTAMRPDGSRVLRYDDAAPRADMTGDVEAMAMYSGTGCGRIREVVSAGPLTRVLGEEALERARLLTANG